MRIDIVTIFPRYFDSLDVSLIGKAREGGLLDLDVHDLREWTHDRHRTVDDTPYGGGAGMVMKPDVWGLALDQLLGVGADFDPEDGEQPAVEDGADDERIVLAVPTPSGVPLTQSMAVDLAEADRIVLACGRYEGIDQRVSDHYREREVEVLEYSIGDYVLNGGEVAAMVLIEAVGRLVDGVVGNPDSLVEESFGDGLIEYPNYTKPRTWRGLEVPAPLLSGNHADIERWRRDRSLVRTASRRPDLIDRLDVSTLDGRDREVLADHGYILAPRRANVTLRQARPDEAAEVAELAARTFPLACPEHLGPDAIQEFIDRYLSEDEFVRMMRNPDDYRILVAQTTATDSEPAQMIGYTLTVLAGPDGMPESMVRPGKLELGAAYLSKCYVDPDWHGSGVSGALLERAVHDAAEQGRNSQIALGTNVANKRARKFYKRHGFALAGRRVFDVGGVKNIDDVFVRNITRNGD